MKRPFMRMDKPGPAAVGVFWCEKCGKDAEPELYNNHIEEGGQVLKDLKEICYNNNNQ